MPRSEKLKGATPVLPPAFKAIRPSRSVPDLASLSPGAIDPTGYAAKALQRRHSLSPGRSRKSASSPAATPTRRSASPRLDYVSIERSDPQCCDAEPSEPSEASTARTPLSSIKPHAAARRTDRSNTATPTSVARKQTAKASASPRHVVFTKSMPGSHAGTAAPAAHKTGMDSAGGSREQQLKTAARPAQPPAAAAPPPPEERHGDEAPESITLERADFRQLVVALRNLREQRSADLVALRSARESLRTICAVAAREAPQSQAVQEAISAVLLPYELGTIQKQQPKLQPSKAMPPQQQAS